MGAASGRLRLGLLLDDDVGSNSDALLSSLGSFLLFAIQSNLLVVSVEHALTRSVTMSLTMSHALAYKKRGSGFGFLQLISMDAHYCPPALQIIFA